MTLPPADAVREWRARLMPWVMAVVRLGAGWLVCRGQFAVLLASDSPLRERAGALTVDVLAALLALGILAFAWPRSYLFGAALLALGLGAFEWLWRQSGQPPGPLPWSLGILAVLALGEWLNRLVRRRLPGT